MNIGDGSDPRLRQTFVTRDGDKALNTFPVRYFDQGTHKVRHPDAGYPKHAAEAHRPGAALSSAASARSGSG